MICCRDVANLLFDYVSNELPSEQRHLVDQHLCQCSSCVTYLQTYRVTITVSRRLPQVAPPPELLRRLEFTLGSQPMA